MEHVHTKRRPSYQNADWLLLRNCHDNGIHAVSSVGSPSKRLEASCSLHYRGEAVAVPIKVVCRRENHWMYANLNSFLRDATSCSGISESIARSGWRRTARSTDSQKSSSGQPVTGTWIIFSNINMPSRNGLQCASHRVWSLTPQENSYCTEVERTLATARRPQLSFKSTPRSAVAKVIRTPGKQSWISDALHDPHAPPRGSRSMSPSSTVNFSRRFLNSRRVRRQALME